MTGKLSNVIDRRDIFRGRPGHGDEIIDDGRTDTGSDALGAKERF